METQTLRSARNQEVPGFNHKPGRIDVYCLHCGSRDVQRDASAVWSIPEQAWVLCAVYDNAVCEQCGCETRLGEAPLAKNKES